MYYVVWGYVSVGFEWVFYNDLGCGVNMVNDMSTTKKYDNFMILWLYRLTGWTQRRGSLTVF